MDDFIALRKEVKEATISILNVFSKSSKLNAVLQEEREPLIQKVTGSPVSAFFLFKLSLPPDPRLSCFYEYVIKLWSLLVII